MAMESNLHTSTQPLETKETHSLIGAIRSKALLSIVQMARKSARSSV